MNERAEALDFLSRLGAQPAVAFHEAGVAAAVRSILEETGVGYSLDAFGNILAKLPGRNPDVPPLAIVAHMDHPGFELTGRHGDGAEFVADALGGIPASSFSEGVPLQVILPGGQRIAALTAGPYGDESERRALVRVADASLAAELPLPAAAVFDLPDFELDGEYIRMRAVDDLAGCASALAAMARLVRSGEQPEGDVYTLFTRAEEVGLVGARLAANAGLLPSGTLIVSAESSRTLPGAEQGRGPVIRVGDAGSTFDADAESVLIRAREALNEQEGGFAAQRQLMSGGVCEASAFAGRRRFHLRRRRRVGADSRAGSPERAGGRLRGAAATDERRRLRGQRLRCLRLPNHRHRLPPGQLPQRRARRPHRGRVHPCGRLPRWRGLDGGSRPPRVRPGQYCLPQPVAIGAGGYAPAAAELSI